jgi:hypothetical protein
MLDPKLNLKKEKARYQFGINYGDEEQTECQNSFCEEV